MSILLDTFLVYFKYGLRNSFGAWVIYSLRANIAYNKKNDISQTDLKLP